jgi:hypothetical protein
MSKGATVYAMDSNQEYALAMAGNDKLVHVYDVRKWSRINGMVSGLKYSVRSTKRI